MRSNQPFCCWISKLCYWSNTHFDIMPSRSLVPSHVGFCQTPNPSLASQSRPVWSMRQALWDCIHFFVGNQLHLPNDIYIYIYIYYIYILYLYITFIYNLLLLYRSYFAPPTSCFRLDVPGTSWASPRDTKGTMAFNERTAQRSFCCSCDTKCCSSWKVGPEGFVTFGYCI